MLESVCHGDCCFVTLTYSPENVPEGGNLNPKDPQDWLKRLRKELAPRRIRYYLVGEYGDETWRPHYHVALYGVSQLEHEVVNRTWGLGHTMVGDLTMKSAAYVAGYVTKKMTKREDPRLCGKHPEFARMSLKPGLGADAMTAVVNAIGDGKQADIVLSKNAGDVPNSLMHGIRRLPLGRYLRRKIREKVLGSPETPEVALQAYGQELRRMFEVALSEEKYRSKNLKQILVDKNAQAVLNEVTRMKIHSKKGSL